MFFALLVDRASAYDMEEACATITVPADALPYYDDDRGVDEAWTDVTAAANVWSDGCVWVWDEDAIHETCTTPDGAEWSRDSWSGTGWSVALPEGLDSWTDIQEDVSFEVGEEESSQWARIAWTGSIPGLPDDASLTRSSYGGSGMMWSEVGEAYATPGCAWSWGSYLTEWETRSVTVGETTVRVAYKESCSRDEAAYHVAYVDDVLYGAVDWYTWELAEVDRDGFGPDWDCDDDDPSVHPCATEVEFDGIDQDCDGSDDIDGDDDRSGDIAWGGTDCDDADPAVHPGASDPAGDGIDQNCDGADEVDADGDGFTVDGDDGEPDCDDGDATVQPGAADPAEDGIDQNCDGADEVDADGDGFTVDGDDGEPDCDDTDGAAFPGATEVPDDGLDQDCDGEDLVTVEETDTGEAAPPPRKEEEGTRCGLPGGPAGLTALVPVLLALGARRRL